MARGARGLSGQLRRLAPNLRQLGYDIEFDLPNRFIRLGMQTTVPTEATVAGATSCDSLHDAKDGSDGQMQIQSNKVVCDCGEPMTLSETLSNGRQDWDCPGCGRSKPATVHSDDESVKMKSGAVTGV